MACYWRRVTDDERFSALFYQHFFTSRSWDVAVKEETIMTDYVFLCKPRCIFHTWKSSPSSLTPWILLLSFLLRHVHRKCVILQKHRSRHKFISSLMWIFDLFHNSGILVLLDEFDRMSHTWIRDHCQNNRKQLSKRSAFNPWYVLPFCFQLYFVELV